MPNKDEGLGMFQEMGSPLTSIPAHEADGYRDDEAPDDDTEDAEELLRTEDQPKEKAGRKKLLSLLAAGSIALMVIGFIAFQVYSKISRNNKQPEAGLQQPNQATERPAALQNPYAQAQNPTKLPPAVATQEPPTIPATPIPANDPSQAGTSLPQQTAPTQVPVTSTTNPYSPPPVATAQIGSVPDPADPQMARRLSELGSRVDGLDQKLSLLMETVNAMKSKAAARPEHTDPAAKIQPAKKQETPAKPAGKAKVDGKTASDPKFHIMSVVAGQAWIASNSSNEVEIVRVGEVMSDGSKVTKIEPAQNKVTTTRGVIRGE